MFADSTRLADTTVLLPLLKPSRVGNAVSGYFVSNKTKNLFITRDYTVDIMELDGDNLILKDTLQTSSKIDLVTIFKPNTKKPKSKKSDISVGTDWLAILLSDGRIFACTYNGKQFINTCIGRDSDYVKFRNRTNVFFMSNSTSLFLYSRPGVLIEFKWKDKIQDIIQSLTEGDLSSNKKLMEKGTINFMPQFDTITATMINTTKILIIGRENGQLFVTEATKVRTKIEIISQTVLFHDYNIIIPLRQIRDRAEMAILIGDRYICLWKSQTELPNPIEIEDSISCYVKLIKECEDNIDRYLFGTNSGYFHVMTANLMDGSIDISTIDYQSESTCQISHLDDDVYFISNSMTGPEVVRVFKSSNDRYQMTRLERVDSSFPILDFSARTYSNCSIDVIACCGGPPSGALMRLKYGYDLQVMATADIDENICDCWSFRYSDKLHWAFTGPYSTEIFEVNAQIESESVDIPNIDTDNESILICSVENVIYQVTSHELRSSESGIIYKTESVIRLAAWNKKSEICMAIGNNTMITFHLKYHHYRSLELTAEITAFSYSYPYLAVGLNNSEIHLFFFSCEEPSIHRILDDNRRIHSLAWTSSSVLYASTNTGVYMVPLAGSRSRTMLKRDGFYRLFMADGKVLACFGHTTYLLDGKKVNPLNAGIISNAKYIGNDGRDVFDNDRTILMIRETEQGREICVATVPKRKTTMVKRIETRDAIRRILRFGDDMLITLRLVYDENEVSHSTAIPRRTVVELRDVVSFDVLDEIILPDYELGECIESIPIEKDVAPLGPRFVVGTSIINEDNHDWKPTTEKKPQGRIILFNAIDKRLELAFSYKFIEGGISEIKYAPWLSSCFCVCQNLLFQLEYRYGKFKQVKDGDLVLKNEIKGLDICDKDKKLVIGDNTGGLFVKRYLPDESNMRTLQIPEKRYVINVTNPIFFYGRWVNTILIGQSFIKLGDSSPKTINVFDDIEENLSEYYKELDLEAVKLGSVGQNSYDFFDDKEPYDNCGLIATAEGALYLYGVIDAYYYPLEIVKYLPWLIERNSDIIGKSKKNDDLEAYEMNFKKSKVVDLRYLDNYWLMTPQQKEEMIEILSSKEPNAMSSKYQGIKSTSDLDSLVIRISVDNYVYRWITRKS